MGNSNNKQEVKFEDAEIGSLWCFDKGIREGKKVGYEPLIFHLAKNGNPTNFYNYEQYIIDYNYTFVKLGNTQHLSTALGDAVRPATPLMYKVITLYKVLASSPNKETVIAWIRKEAIAQLVQIK